MGTKRASLSDAALRTGLSRYAYRGRHRTPDATGTAVRSAALSAGVVAAVMVGSAASASAAPVHDPWYRLRMCESGGNYSTNTGNGYYGAYQFDLRTWRAYGGSGLPSDASAAEQDRRARMLYRARGWAPWPACSRSLGLRRHRSYGVAATRPTTLSAPAVVKLGVAYTIRGTARPGSRVLVRLGPVGGTFTSAYRRPVNRAGRWSLVWRGTNDYRYYALGETRTAVKVTRVAATATATVPGTARLAGSGRAAAGARTVVTVSGTTRPNATVLLYVRTPGRNYVAYRKFTASGGGRYVHRFRAPAGTFAWYVRSSNGLYSRVGKVSL